MMLNAEQFEVVNIILRFFDDPLCMSKMASCTLFFFPYDVNTVLQKCIKVVF
jgi:hypothetical protein